MSEWYRRGTWSAADRGDFAARLERVHSAAFKAQYLRIQAAHFQALGGRPFLEAAVELLDRLVVEFPEPAQLAAAHLQRAECLVALGERLRAIRAYRWALDAQRRFPEAPTEAYLGFGELVLELQRVELYSEVLSAIDELGGGEKTPAQEYRVAAIRAFIHDAGGLRKEARACARRALAAAQRGRGLARQAAVETRLQSLATSTM